MKSVGHSPRCDAFVIFVDLLLFAVVGNLVIILGPRFKLIKFNRLLMNNLLNFSVVFQHNSFAIVIVLAIILKIVRLA